MYRTLIVDDEALMRQYLGNNLTAICPDFLVTGIAKDGLEAADLLQKQNFDLVITDIRMPEMDGLSLAKFIFDSYPETLVIIISGYNEFEYARSAIKYGVSDYLLKPLSDANIQETLARIKGELNKRTAARNTEQPVMNYESLTGQELRSALLSAVLDGNMDLIQHLYGILKNRKLSFPEPCSAVMLFNPDELHLLVQDKKVLENTSYQLELNQQLRQYCSLHDYALTCDKQGHTLILLTAAREEEIPEIAVRIYQEVTHSFWKYRHLRLNCSYGPAVNDMMSLNASYSAAVKALALSLKNVPPPITSGYFISQKEFLYELNTICDSLYSDFISGNADKTITDLYLYISLFEQEISIASILRYGSYLIRYLSGKCGIKTEYLLTAFGELIELINNKLPVRPFDKDSVHMLFFNMLRVLRHDELPAPVSDSIKTVEGAREYICTHYREQISLAMVAESLKVNPSYLSDLFHKSFGEPYTKFLTRIRMEQALLLLKSNPNEKIYRVAEKTGFISAKHFNHVFKKYYGFTPTEYMTRKMY